MQILLSGFSRVANESGANISVCNAFAVFRAANVHQNMETCSRYKAAGLRTPEVTQQVDSQVTKTLGGGGCILKILTAFSSSAGEARGKYLPLSGFKALLTSSYVAVLRF